MLLAGVLVLSACTSTPGTPTAQTTTALTTAASTTTAAPATTTTAAADHDLGEGFVWHGPADTSVIKFSPGSGDCRSAVGQLGQGDQAVTLTLLAADCAPTTELPINGNHGRYLVPPERAKDVSAPTAVPAGSLVTFWETYSEYTNSRTDYVDSIGLITLGSKKTYAVLMVTATRGKAAVPELVTRTACAIRPSGSPLPQNTCG